MSLVLLEKLDERSFSPIFLCFSLWHVPTRDLDWQVQLGIVQLSQRSHVSGKGKLTA